MSRKIYVYTCVLFILLIGLSALSAENVTNDNTDNANTVSADTDSTAAINNDVPVKHIDDTTRNDDVEYNNHTLKTQDKNLKSKSPMQISVDDYTCDVDDVIHVTTHMNPAGVTEGVLMYSIDDDLIGTCSLLNVGNELDIDTYGYEPGEHELMVEFTASLSYESAEAHGKLTIYKPIDVTSSKNNLILNSTRLNDSLVLGCDDINCHSGDMDLYIDDKLIKSYNGIDYDGFEVKLNHYEIDLANGIHSWSLRFNPDNEYVRADDLTGSISVNFLPRGQKYRLNMESDDLVCNYGDNVVLNVSFTDPSSGDLLYINEGVILYYVDDDLTATHNLSYATTDYNFDTNTLFPGVYPVEIQYTASLIYESITLTKTLTINHEYTVNANTTRVSYNHRTQESDVILLSCNDTLGFGDIDVYINDKLRGNITDVDYDNYELTLDEDLTGITDDGNYTYTLKFKPYYDNIQVNNITGTIEATGFKNDLQINTQPVTAYVGDVVDIPVNFNDTVSDGTLSISYGESTDNTITVDTDTDSISFDTNGYLQGEYELKILYTDGSQHYDTQTTTTLYLYQPTTLTIAEDEYNVVLGKNNSYEIEFTSSLDEYDDVIWGSIDIYIDDVIVDTLIIDDDAGNTAVLILDDYNMETLAPGAHTLRAVFTSDDEYVESSTATTTLNVQGEVIIALPQNITTMTGQAIVIPNNVSFNGHKITNGVLNYYIDDTLVATQTINTENTNYTINTNNYNPDIYELRVEYTDASGVYTTNTNTTDLIIRSDVSITTKVLNNTVRNITIEITLKDSRDNPISGLINITLPDGSRQLNIPVTGGVATLTLTNQNPGSNIITISYPESVLYNAKTIAVLVDVVKLNSTTTASITNTSSQNTTIHVQVTDEKTGQTITTGTIQIVNTANNEIVGQATLNGQEEVTITTTLENQGLYNLRVDYTGNDIYNTSNTLLENVEVTGRLSQLQLNTLNDTLDNTTITIQSIDPVTNTPITNAPITITLPNGHKINTNTGASGIVTQKLDLPVGTNTITIDYPGDEHYNKTTTTYTMNVAPRASTTTAQITNKTIRNTTLQVTVTDKETGTPVTSGTITVINTATGQTVATAQLTDENPITITTDIDAAGVYNLEVLFNNNVNYTPSSTTIEDVVVSKRASQTQVTITDDVYEDSKITVKVTDPVTDTPIINAQVTITLPNEESINTNTDDNGIVTVPVDLPVGTNTVTVQFNGNNEYNTSQDTQTINIQKRASTTTAAIVNNTIRNTTIEVTITDKETGNPVTSGYVEVIDTNTNNVIGSTTLHNSNKANITTNINTAGTYDLLVKYYGNDHYNASTATLNDITVTKRTAQIETTTINNTLANTTINIKVVDSVTQQPIKDTPVTVTLPDGTTITGTTDKNGNITINPLLPVGENTLTIETTPTTEYNKTTTTTTVNIQQRPSTTSATITNNTLSNTTIQIKVHDAATGKAITSGTVTVINAANNAVLATGTLTSSNINLTADITASGTYNIIVRYNGNTNYTPSQTTLNDVNIEKRLATITITTNNNTIGNTTINITVKDSTTGQTITNAPIKITLPNGEEINTHTGPTGSVTIPVNIASGQNKITVTYTGSNTYKPTSTTHNIDVNKLPSKITVTKQTAYIGDTITLNANVTDTNGNPLNGGKLVFKLNGITLKDTNDQPIYARVTGGKASINYTIPYTYNAKTYKISATYEGNDQYYGNTSNTPLLNVKQRQATLNIQTNQSVEVDQTLTINVQINDKKDQTRIVNGYVIFKIDGLTIKDTNNQTIQVAIKDNKAQYTYTVGHEYSARKHTITAVLINNTYVRSQANNTFNITQTQTQIQLNTPQKTNNNIKLTGQLTDAAGHTLSGTNKAIIKINGITLKTTTGTPQYHTITDGQINITLNTTLKNGTHNITLVTGQRGAFTGARNNTTITINNEKTKTLKTATITQKQLVNIIPQKQIAITNETSTISIKIQDSNNKPIKKGQVTFTQNGKTLSTTTITNGIALLNHKYNKAGTYNIQATYNDPTGTYQDTTKQFTITIKDQVQTTTKISANNTTTRVGETLTYTSLFTDNYNNKIQTGHAMITIQNKTTTTKITNGIAIITHTFNKTGKYPVTITSGNTKITRQITVTKQNPTIKINKPTITAGTINNITATITTQTGVPLNEGKIQWKINGQTLKNTKGQTIQTSIKDGTSTFTYNMPTTWAGKQINITSTYTGNNNYNTRQTTLNKINIPQLQATAKTTITPNTPQTKDNITIQVTITDKNTGKTITTNDKIAIKINGKTIATPRLKNGSATIQYKLPLLKTNRTHNITVVYGNKNYKRLDANKKFNIQRINTTTTLNTITIKKGQTLHIKTTIKDTHQETMQRNNTYCIKLNQKTIHTGKLNNGILDTIIPINYKPRTYTLTIKTGNNYYYNGLTKDTKLTITQ